MIIERSAGLQVRRALRLRQVTPARDQERADQAPERRRPGRSRGPIACRAHGRIRATSYLCLLARLRLAAARDGDRGEADRGARGRGDAERLPAAPLALRQRLVEAAPVPEPRLGAAEAAVTAFDRPARAVVPLDRGAGVVGDRALAADLEQAPALLRAFVVERLGELAALVERTAVAAVVDVLAVERLRAVRGGRAPAAGRTSGTARARR